VPTLAGMSGFAVTLSSVRQAAAETASVGDELGAELARLRREADDVLAGSWRGAAAVAFDRAWGSWDVGAREVVAALERLTDLLVASSREYSLGDATSSDELKRAAP
jgi:WXG100 family type VII secretion target